MKTRIFRPSAQNLAYLANLLRQDEVVGVPAETVYGLAGNGLSAMACARIFDAKQRPAHDPLILHLADLEKVEQVCHWSSDAQKLAERFWPGPLTMVLPKKSVVPDIATSGLPSVAIRMPAHPVFRELLHRVDFPLAAPSANPFGYISPTNAKHVKDGLDGRIPAVLDGGNCTVGIESTIVDLRDVSAIRILRPGVVSHQAISEALRRPVLTTLSVDKNLQSVAPGQLDKHYSPRTPLELVSCLPPSAPNVAIVTFSTPPMGTPNRQHFVLSPDGSGESAAQNLFHLLRQLDRQDFQKIYIEIPPTDIEHRDALMDRLTRASKK